MHVRTFLKHAANTSRNDVRANWVKAARTGSGKIAARDSGNLKDGAPSLSPDK